jgi:hypothetical protein|tara:strand:+ start:288 stop:470 length:183 start_codon:yes stop_codon:yes gene_type:complete
MGRNSKLIRVDLGFAKTITKLKKEHDVSNVKITRELDRMLKRKNKKEKVKKELRGFRFRI